VSLEWAACRLDVVGVTPRALSRLLMRALVVVLAVLLVVLLAVLVLALTVEPAVAQANAVATGDSVWSAVKSFFYGKWALVIGCLVLVGCVFAFFSKGAMFASVGVAAVVVIYLLPAIAQGLQSLAQGMVGN